MEYNTQRPSLILREHGRNIQKLVKHIKTIEDEEKKSEFARTLVDLMRRIDPETKDYPEYQQKLWDDLHIMADYVLDFKAPYPAPAKSVDKKPQRVGYQKNRIRYKHYGRNIELLVKKGIDSEDPEEKKATIVKVGKLMRVFYHKYNNEIISDKQILENIKELSKGKLEIDPAEVEEHKLFEVSLKDRPLQSGRDNSRGRDSRGRNNNGRSKGSSNARSSGGRSSSGGRNSSNRSGGGQSKSRRRN